MNKMLLIETIIVRHRSKLTEGADTSLSYIVEKRENKIVVRVPATILDEKNENGRTYSTKVMEKAIKSCKKDIDSRKLLCTVDDHPKDPYVAPGNASHVVVSAWVEKGHLYNEWEILETSKGKDLKALVDAEVSFGVSIRGLGSVDQAGNIQEDYEYLGTDCVGNPSAKIWARPELVDHITRKDENTQGIPTLTNRRSRMNSVEEVLKYIKEQGILLASDKMVEKMRRVVDVEDQLSQLKLPPKDISQIFTEWEQVKNKELAVLNKDPVVPAIVPATVEKTQTEFESTIKMLRQRLLDYRTAVPTLKGSIAQLSTALRTKLREFNISKKNITVLTEENAALKSNLSDTIIDIEASSNVASIAYAMAAEYKLKYESAVTYAGKLQIELAKKPSLTVQTESLHDKSGADLTLITDKDKTRSTAEKSDKRFTESNKSGEVKVPGWY